MKAKLTLVGAGPGDEELITLKGVKALQSADVVLYDDLVSTELLAYAPADSPRYYVGKRVGNASYSQEEINQMAVDMAFHYGHVVRLKGGDSFVFGRGHEEYVYATERGLPCEVVPGISSCIAVPESQGIPVTRRGVSESFWVITGTTRDGSLSGDLQLAAESNATVVVLMGLKKLGELCELYRLKGRADMPVAVIQNGTRKDERYVVGRMSDIEDLVKQENLGYPAVIVIGAVVELHPDYVRQYVEVNGLVAHS